MVQRKPSSRRSLRPRVVGLVGLVACVASTACGGGGGVVTQRSPIPIPIRPGGIRTIMGTGDKATDPVDANADGKVDAPMPALWAHLDSPLDVAFSSEGRPFVIDWNGHKIRAMNPDGTLAFVTGTGKEGDACETDAVDGKCPAAFAEMNHPTDVTFDADGRLVVAAWHNAKIKRLDFSTGLVENVCGTGSRKYEGNGLTCISDAGIQQVSLDLPSSVVFDAAGNLFIADQANQEIRRIAASDGIVTAVAGHCPGTPGFGCPAGRGYSGDGGPATQAEIANNLGQGTDPQGKIAVDKAGNLYIADTGNNVIRKVTPGSDGIVGDGEPSEEIITTIAGTGEAGYGGDGGPAAEAQLSSPTDVAIDDDGTIYVADRSNSCVRRIAPDLTISTVAGRCGTPGYSGDGSLATEAELRTPYGVALDGKGSLYIADTRNNCIRQVMLPR